MLRLLKRGHYIVWNKASLVNLAPNDPVLNATESKLEESSYDVRRQILEAESQLNVLMNRPAQEPLPRPEKPGIPAVHLDLERVQALASGMDDFVRKPYRPAEIFDCIAHHLGIHFHRESEEASRNVESR